MRRIGQGVLICLGLATSVAAQNRQPISTSLTECAVINDEIFEFGRKRGITTEENETDVQDRALLFRLAAITQARREGIKNPQAYIDNISAELKEKWTGRFSRLWKIGENADWIDYCLALGRDRGLMP